MQELSPVNALSSGPQAVLCCSSKTKIDCHPEKIYFEVTHRKLSSSYTCYSYTTDFNFPLGIFMIRSLGCLCSSHTHFWFTSSTNNYAPWQVSDQMPPMKSAISLFPRFSSYTPCRERTGGRSSKVGSIFQAVECGEKQPCCHLCKVWLHHCLYKLHLLLS